MSRTQIAMELGLIEPDDLTRTRLDLDVSEAIDRDCEKQYGHRNWSYDKDNNIVVSDTPHNEDGDCLCADINNCLLEKEAEK